MEREREASGESACQRRGPGDDTYDGTQTACAQAPQGGVCRRREVARYESSDDLGIDGDRNGLVAAAEAVRKVR